MSQAVAYIRVSTDTTRQELGAEAQKAEIMAWAAKHNVQIVAWYADEVSGAAATEQRRGLLEAVAAVKAYKAAYLVFQKWDRFTRDTRLTALIELQIEKLGARLVPANGVGSGDDPASMLVKDVLLASAKFERSLIKERVRAALAVKKQRGEPTGGVAPYGFRREGDRLVRDEAEQRILATARQMRQSGMSVRRVREALGPVNRAGRLFSVSNLHAMVSAPSA